MYHTRHHTFPDTDPYKVDDALDALRERLGIHAQLDKQQALDMLVAPLYDAQGVLRGTLAIDEPLDGRRPAPDRRRVLERFASMAGRAVLASVERESLAEQVMMADTVKEIVRTTSAQLSLDGLL